MDTEQDITYYDKRGWKLIKLQRVITQRSIFLRTKQKTGTTQLNNGASEELWKYWVQFTNICLIEEILYRNIN